MDANDFTEFYRRHYNGTLSFASKRIYDHEAVRDIVGDVWARLWEKHEALDDVDYLEGLLYASVRNKCADYLYNLYYIRTQQAKMKRTADTVSDDFLEQLYHKELFQFIGRTISNATPLGREAFLKIRIGGFTYREVSKELNATRRALEYQMRKTNKTVIAALRKRYG